MFAARFPDIERTERATDRTRLIAEKNKESAVFTRDFERASWAAEAGMRVARNSGQFPMLSRGDTNIYALFVERGLSLLKPDGILGLLVPSGIAADKGAAEFFRSVSTTGRLGAFFDFENRPAGPTRTQFFPDVYYRFKFAALIIGGFKREFESAACAFFQTVRERRRDNCLHAEAG